MKKGQYVVLLVNYRYHKAGHVGKIEEVLGDGLASVDLNWRTNNAKHIIYIREEFEGELWKFLQG